MATDYKTKQKAAREFVQEWAGRGYEKGDAQVFWTELLRDVVGIKRVSSEAKFEYRTADGGFIDVLIPDAGVLIEQKGLNVDLDKPEERQGRMVTPFEQALAYAESFPRDIQPRFIVTCNFGTFRVYDRDAYSKAELSSHPLEFTLEELPDHLEYLDFLTDPTNSRLEKEKVVSIEAGRLVGKLYDALQERYIDPESPESQHSLNVLSVRIVFSMICEEARRIFTPNAFFSYLQDVPPENIRPALQRLFVALDTPMDERDPYDERVKPFPYVNGGLFQEECEIPNFTPELKRLLLDECAGQTDWSKISPTIFGSIFESTLNPQTRHEGGMHYTSPENIHKVIDPLFLDALYQELDEIRSAEGVTEKKRRKALEEFRNKIGSMRFLDPACGSGNFLTESFLSLRQLEDDVLNELHRGQVEIVFETPDNDRRVSLDQFYGIEINDFACRVAKTALWIAQLQANNESESMLDVSIEDFPLKDSANIVCGNALRMNWNDVLPAEKCNYIIGNPPFNGARTMTEAQKEEIKDVAAGVSNNHDLDYVSGWYVKTLDMMEVNSHIKAALVSTNSITQGAQAADLWNYVLGERGAVISFAWRTFIWNNESIDEAHVHCVIVGFQKEKSEKRLLVEADGTTLSPENINGYLLPMDNFYIKSRRGPLCNVPPMANGNQPRDGGNFVLKPEERDAILANEPGLARFIRPYIGAEEFLKGKERYCIWLEDADEDDIVTSPILSERVKAVYDFRMASKAKTTNGYAKTPTLFAQRPQKQGVDFLLLPMTSSERRKYLPIGYMNKDVIASNAAFVVADATLYHFGVLTSLMHNAWMRAVAGRLKSDYRYSKEIVYNDFPWPNPTDEQRAAIEKAAQAVLDARANHPSAAPKDMYDPDNEFLYQDLMQAHRKLDTAVETAYGVNFDGNEEKMVAHLFKLYAEAAQ